MAEMHERDDWALKGDKEDLQADTEALNDDAKALNGDGDVLKGEGRCLMKRLSIAAKICKKGSC